MDQVNGAALVDALEELERLIRKVPIMVWDPDTRDFKGVESVTINGPAIQINVEAWKGKKVP